MKEYLTPIVAACFGLCVGFAVCYFCLLIPHHGNKAGASTPQEQKTIITITQNGTLYLAGERLDISQLTLRLKGLGRTQPVVIRADPTSDAQRIIEVMEACKAASVSRIWASVAAR
jgi:biopolymer transport protein ExbD